MKGNRTRIMVFGPSLSGKSTVLRAFLHVMTNEELRKAYDHLDLRLFVEDEDSPDGLRLFQHTDVSKDFPETTIRQIFSDYILHRKLRNPTNTREDILNSHQYTLEMLDFPGKMYQNAAEVRTIQSFRDLLGAGGDFAAAWGDLSDADGIIVLLDPMIVWEDTEPKSDLVSGRFSGEDIEKKVFGQSPQTARTVTKNQYANMVARLTLLPKRTGPHFNKQFVAICVNKIDRLGPVQRRAPGDIIRDQFGPNMLESINNIRAHFGMDNVRLFSISALGTVNGEENWDGKWLKDPEKWAPIRVEEPFFWICQQVERYWVETAIRDNLILSKIPFVRRPFTKEATEMYRPYLDRNNR